LRLQLIALLALGGIARAEDKVDIGVSYFSEPIRAQALHVITPSVRANVDAHRTFSIRMGYDVDIVTGSTPRLYGSSVDAISSATHFSDYRHAFHGGAEARIAAATLDLGYTYAFENDYRSHSIDASAKVDLWGKNTSFRLGYAHNFDSVCDADNAGAQPLERKALATSKGCFNSKTPGVVTEPLAIDSYFIAWTQVWHPIVLSDISASFQSLDGFQSNPYRLVRLFSGTIDAQESEPRIRERLAVSGRLRIAIKKAHAAVGIGGRYYWDTWAIQSGTVELEYEQYLASSLLLRLRGRFYQQSRALFYRDAGEVRSYESVGPVGQYFAGDRELAPFRDYLVGLKLSYLKNADERGKIGRVFEALELGVKVDGIFYQYLTPQPPNAARTYAVLLQLGLSLRW
jgi:hypothetical protein